MATKGFYTILGIQQDATAAQIKKAYRKLALKYHPDKNPNNKEAAEERFREIQQAYEVLKDPEKKAIYDQLGHAAFEQSAQQGAGGQNFYQQEVNLEEIFRHMKGMFHGREHSFQQGGRGSAYRSKGEDLRITLKITLREVLEGVKRTIELPHYIACKACYGNGAHQGISLHSCSNCHGSGSVEKMVHSFLGQMVTHTPCNLCEGSGKMIAKQCNSCQGEGRIKEKEQITLKLQPGLGSGYELRKRGKGNAARRGGVAGDLLIAIEQLSDPNFQREKNDIHHRHYISFSRAISGGSIEIPTLTGRVRVKIPATTQSGHVLRLRGKGLPDLQGYQKGDQLVHLYVWTPTQLSEKDQALVDSLEKNKNFHPKGEDIAMEDTSFFDRIKAFFS